MTSSRLDRIICYGDSQTAGFSWGPRMVALSDTLTEAIGRGVSGQEAGSVAIRQGGITLTTVEAVTIPASAGPVDLDLAADVTPCNIRVGASDMPMVLAGVRGTLTIASTDGTNAGTLWDRAAGSGRCVFVPAAAPSSPVSVPAGTALVSQDVADHPEWSECLQILWVGGNDAAFAGASRVTGVTAAVQAMVDRLRDAVDEPRFLVAGRTTGPTNTEGTSSWQTAVDQRDALATLYPDNAVDIWGYVRDHGLDILGITPTQADLDALAGKTVPPSLTTDGLHYSTETREKVLAPFIISELAARGWTTPKEASVAYTPKLDWKTGDELPAAHLNELEQAAADGARASDDVTAATEAAAAAGQGVADLQETKADKAALTAGLAKKVDVKDAASKNTVYGISNGGSLFMYPTGVSTVAASTVAMRGTGGVLKVGTATDADHAVTKAQLDAAIDGTLKLGTTATTALKGDTVIPAATASGTRDQLDAGTDTTVRAFSAKDIAEYVAAQIAAATPPAEG